MKKVVTPKNTFCEKAVNIIMGVCKKRQMCNYYVWNIIFYEEEEEIEDHYVLKKSAFVPCFLYKILFL